MILFLNVQNAIDSTFHLNVINIFFYFENDKKNYNN